MKDLMTPRYEVIADYPSSKFEKGEVIELSVFKDGTIMLFKAGFICYTDSYLDKYPHLFRKLQWYEKRDIKDMPEYVKDNFKGKIVIKVHRYMEGTLSDFFVSEANKDTEHASHLSHYLPATQSEYDNYINSKI